MRITPGNFSFLPELSDDQIAAQINYCLRKGWAVSIEYTNDFHPRNTYWEPYGSPMLDRPDAASIMDEINACRRTYCDRYVRVMALDTAQDACAVVMSFLVNRPREEFGFRLTRTEACGRSARFGVEGHATRRPDPLMGLKPGSMVESQRRATGAI